MRLFNTVCFSALALFLSTVALACPDITKIPTPENKQDWQQLEQQLSPYLQSCLRSSEYFALYGAAQLNNEKLPEALETLERALMLNPDNGSALIDYSEALFLSGQPVAALELNTQLQTRTDLPEHLRPILQTRATYWQTFTRRLNHRFGAQVGYDNNLNGAPQLDALTLTLSDQLVELSLDESSKPISGFNTKLHFSSTGQSQSAENRDYWHVAANTRFSEDQNSDIVQLNAKYSHTLLNATGEWEWYGDLSYLHYGGNSLYGATEAGGNYTFIDNTCAPRVGFSAQYQNFPGQQEMNGVEMQGLMSATCFINNHSVTTELRSILNVAENNTRPGQDRQGWEFRTHWLTTLYQGYVATEFRYTLLDDDSTYSSILANGAARGVTRKSLSLQYIKPINNSLALTINLFHQTQKSNIELFQNSDTSIDLGVSLSF